MPFLVCPVYLIFGNYIWLILMIKTYDNNANITDLFKSINKKLSSKKKKKIDFKIKNIKKKWSKSTIDRNSLNV